jgi:D-threo-aldose 1-dehydrogenase
VNGLPTVSLPGTGITTTVLGFGCSRLLGPKSVAEALRLLETAYDAGIRHFDVARAYGSGDAEGVLGRFIATRRDQVTVTTKFGISPRPIMDERRLLLAGARTLMKVSPLVRRFLGRQGARLVKRKAFSADDASGSLETSLRELRTDYIDLLLLHDCDPADCSPELLEFLNGAVSTGKIRAFGVGTSAESAATIARSTPAFATVLQFGHSVLHPTVRQVDPNARHALITHGALADLRRLRRHMEEQPEARMRWSAELGVDCGRERPLAALMLRYAIQTNGRGPVLAASTNPENIVANAAAAADGVPSRSAVDRFAELVAAEVARTP